MNKQRLAIWLLSLLSVVAIHANKTSDVLNSLDLTRPGLEKVKQYHEQKQDSLAAIALLDYFQQRTGVKNIAVDPANPKISKEEQRWADEALEHKFFVHKGYQPSYSYGDDINWRYWPVKDNELRWQLHRMKWWVPMGKAYRLSGDEKYAREWVAQYRDWIKKNPYGKFTDKDDAENVRFAWRPLEVSDRLEHQIEQFDLFLPSPNFTPEFLIEFLDNYHKHAEYANTHYSREGNHLLFEAQRVIYAGAFFPEFKNAQNWRKTAVDILNREIKKQVFADGVQYELDPGYHMACIGIFGKAVEMMDANGYRGEFPKEYLDIMNNMVVYIYNVAFPNYTMPLFSDNKAIAKSTLQRFYREWRKFFADDKHLEYFATDGKSGELPDYTSRAFPVGGFYIMRSGWGPESTMMTLKAGPKGEWHNQFDNGTFEMYVNGRNFFPDSGCFIFGGDGEVQKQRDWFRQTAVHNTLTLDNRNLETRESQLLKWETTPNGDVVVVETPGYDGLTHRRAVFFVDKKFYVIADEAYGDATGNVSLHYQLLSCAPDENKADKYINTVFKDGNNIAMQVFGADTMTEEEGWTSPAYREKNARPAYAFSTEKKDANPARFITVIMPTNDANPSSHKIKASYKGNYSPNGAKLEVSIDGKKYPLSYKVDKKKASK